MCTIEPPTRPGVASDSESREGRIGSLGFALYKCILSPILHVLTPTECKYLPTCSEYAYVAVTRFGAARGSWLALRRVFRCHPWTKGGLDPVPENENGRRPF